jgi:hypothetical protein
MGMGEAALLALLVWAAAVGVSVIRKTPPTTHTLRSIEGCLMALILLFILVAALFPPVQ